VAVVSDRIDNDAPVTVPAVLLDMLTDAYSMLVEHGGDEWSAVMFAQHVDPWGNPTVREYRLDSIRVYGDGVRAVVTPVGGEIEDSRDVDPSLFHAWEWSD